MTDSKQQILVLSSDDHAESMRVAAGLTIFGHQVELIFINRIVEENEANIEQAELLDLSGIVPLSLMDDPNIEHINQNQLSKLILSSNQIINI
jgi:hypothetical protein